MTNDISKMTPKQLRTLEDWKFSHDRRADRFYMIYGFAQPDPNSPLVEPTGVLVDITDSIDRGVASMSNYMRRIENLLIETWIQLARERGDTCTDGEILTRLRELDAQVNKGSPIHSPAQIHKPIPTKTLTLKPLHSVSSMALTMRTSQDFKNP